MVEVALLALLVLMLTLTIGVPLPFCFGAALMVMSVVVRVFREFPNDPHGEAHHFKTNTKRQ